MFGFKKSSTKTAAEAINYSEESSGSSSGTLYKVYAGLIRLLQFSLALAVIGLYAPYLVRAHDQHKYYDPRWMYATIVGAATALTALVLIAITVLNRFARTSVPIHIVFLLFWDSFMALNWICVTGIFGVMYSKTRAEGDKGIQEMKNAVWVDLAEMLLFFVTIGVAASQIHRARRSVARSYEG
ncbi:MAG: hypothetical protein M1821_003088 [Bathelium mastoideum]|nr:MAG: hypothetical protein M1821_003088 [Bathelium mastoideum]